MNFKRVPGIIIAQRLWTALLSITLILLKSPLFICGYVVFIVFMCIIFVLVIFLFLCKLLLFCIITNCGRLKPCAASDSWFLFDCNWTNLFYAVVSVYEGEATLEEVSTMMMNRVVLAKTSNGKIFAKHFKHYPVNRLGYHVWKEEENFDIAEHVFEYRKGSATSEKHLAVIIEEIMNETYPRNRSPWFLYLIHICEDENYPTKKTGFSLVLFVNHCLGDGMSTLLLFERYMNEDNKESKDRRNRFKNLSKEKSFVTTITGFTKAVATLPIDFFFEFLYKKKSVLHGPFLSGERICRFGSLMDLTSIKYLKDLTHSSVSDVILSCVTGAFRSYFIRNKLPIPSEFGILLPVNFRPKNFDEQFSNDISGASINLPLKEETPLARLDDVKKRVLKIIPTLMVYFNFFMLQLIGGVVPVKLARCFMMRYKDALCFTNIPGPQKTLNLLNGQTCLFHVALLSLYARQGIGISFNTYKNKAKIGIVVDRVLINDETEVEKILEDITLELDNLTEEVKKLKMTETVENP